MREHDIERRQEDRKERRGKGPMERKMERTKRDGERKEIGKGEGDEKEREKESEKAREVTCQLLSHCVHPLYCY